MANSGVSGGMRTSSLDQHEFMRRCGSSRKMSTRAVDAPAPGWSAGRRRRSRRRAAPCPARRRSRGRRCPRGRIEKIVPIDMLMSMLEEPSSGSIATPSGADGIEDLRQLDLLGGDRGNGRLRSASRIMRVGGDVEVLLQSPSALMPSAAPVMPASGPGDELGDLDGRGRDRLDHLATAAPCGVGEREPIEMRMQGQTRRSMAVLPCVHRSGRASAFRAAPVRPCARMTMSAICSIREISISLGWTKFFL